jgi:hypothetical protein
VSPTESAHLTATYRGPITACRLVYHPTALSQAGVVAGAVDSPSWSSRTLGDPRTPMVLVRYWRCADPSRRGHRRSQIRGCARRGRRWAVCAGFGIALTGDRLVRRRSPVAG